MTTLKPFRLFRSSSVAELLAITTRTELDDFHNDGDGDTLYPALSASFTNLDRNQWRVSVHSILSLQRFIVVPLSS